MTFGQIGVAVAVLLGAILVFGAPATDAHAQSAPFTAYGIGVAAGQVVVAYDGAASCGSTTVDVGGNWMIAISAEAPCHPHDGDTITFTLQGRPTGASESWRTGGAPRDIAHGIALTAAVDTRPPAISVPADVSVVIAKDATSAQSTQPQIAAYLAAAKATDDFDGNVTVTNNAPAVFAIGTTAVIFTAKDKAGNESKVTGHVTVAVGGGPGTFASPLPDTGITPVVWNGGSVDQLVSAGGTKVQSAWVFSNGQAIGYTVGAPGFVNAQFLGLFPGQQVPSGQILVLQLG
jgi:hypothetical protein